MRHTQSENLVTPKKLKKNSLQILYNSSMKINTGKKR